MTEIYPGELVPETPVRNVEEADLELREHPSTIDEAQEIVEGLVFGVQDGGDGGSCSC